MARAKTTQTAREMARSGHGDADGQGDGEVWGECEHHAAAVVPRGDSGVCAGGGGACRVRRGRPWAGVEWHARGRETGTRCRGPEGARIRTASANPAGRAPRMAHSPAMPSAWAVAMAMAGMASLQAAKWARITHSGSCDVAGEMAERGTLLPEPPPGPP